MKRLFISLYLLLCLSILGIGWTLDSIWQNNVDESDVVDAPLTALAQLLSALPESEREQYLNKINTNPAMPLQLLAENQVALDTGSQLSAHRVFTTNSDDGTQLQFIRVADHILMAGPLDIDPRAKIRGLFTLLFYLSLGLVALIWVWPLSRDLRILRRATREFGEAKWHTRIELSPRSQVSPLAVTFNDMARHISALIDNQKHLSNAVSHEIRTPLARLKFALALLPQYCEPDSAPAKRSQFLADMQQDIQEMENLLQELLTYAALESQQKSIQFERCDLISLTKQTVARLSPLSQIPITLDSVQSHIDFLGEPSLIERAIQNLITNAQRFATSQIDIRVASEGKQLKVAVIDDGEGISPEAQLKIFEPFYRGESDQNGTQGHGLGLAIISRIMLRHQGEVTLESRPGYTCFTLTWPNALKH